MRVLLFALLTLLATDPHVEATARRIREALRLSDLSLEKACLYMGLSKAHFSAQLSGVGHISATRMAKLPVEFHRWYHSLGVMDYGLPDRVAKAQGIIRMATMTHHHSEDERKHA